MDQPVAYLFKVITDRIKVKADLQLKRQGLTLSQSKVMAFLSEKGGRAMQKEIEDFLHVSHPTVAGVVSRMEQNGFVETWLDPEDRRNKVVCLTKKSIAIDNEMAELVRRQDELLLEPLTQEQRAEFRKMLKAIYDDLT